MIIMPNVGIMQMSLHLTLRKVTKGLQIVIEICHTNCSQAVDYCRHIGVDPDKLIAGYDQNNYWIAMPRWWWYQGAKI